MIYSFKHFLPASLLLNLSYPPSLPSKPLTGGPPYEPGSAQDFFLLKGFFSCQCCPFGGGAQGFWIRAERMWPQSTVVMSCILLPDALPSALSSQSWVGLQSAPESTPWRLQWNSLFVLLASPSLLTGLWGSACQFQLLLYWQALGTSEGGLYSLHLPVVRQHTSTCALILCSSFPWNCSLFCRFTSSNHFPASKEMTVLSAY